MPRFFSPHARERAKERYGVELSFKDLSRMLVMCRTGGAFQARSNDDSKIFLVTYAGKRFVMVVSKDCDFIITFQPPNYCNAGNGVKRGRWRSRTSRKYPAEYAV